MTEAETKTPAPIIIRHIHELPPEIYNLIFSFTTLHTQVIYETTCKHLVEKARMRKQLTITHQTLPKLTAKALANLLRHYPGIEILYVENYDEAAGTGPGLILAGGLSKNSKLQQLYLINMHLKSSVMTSISSMLLKKNTHLKRFGIIANPILDAGAVAVAEALQNNSTITELDLTGCHFAKKPSWVAPRTGTRELATVLKNTSTLVSLKLAGNSIKPNSVKELVAGLKVNKSLTYLDLSDNKVGDEGVTYITECLQTNRTLEILLLGDNQITDQGAETLAGIIPTTAVGCLALENNLIEDKGCTLITAALRKGSKIHTLIFRGNKASVDLIADLYQVCPGGQTHESGASFGKTIKL